MISFRKSLQKFPYHKKKALSQAAKLRGIAMLCQSRVLSGLSARKHKKPKRRFGKITRRFRRTKRRFILLKWRSVLLDLQIFTNMIIVSLFGVLVLNWATQENNSIIFVEKFVIKQ